MHTWAMLGPFLLLLGIVPASALVSNFQLSGMRRASTIRKEGLLCPTRMSAIGKSVLSKAFQKPTGALTVSIEFKRQDNSDSTENDVIVLSMQLRKIKAAALWTDRY